MSKDERNVEINLTSGNDYTTLTKIPPKDAKDGPRNLGAMLSPEGNNQDEYKKLAQCGRTMIRNISATKLQRHKFLFAYQTMLQPAMKYRLCSSTFTFQQCQQIDRSYMPTLLTRMGFNKMTK